MAAAKSASAYSRQRADDYLTYLEGIWLDVPQLAADWTKMDPVHQLGTIRLWAIPEDRLAQVRKWADEGRLTPEQMVRYQELLKLIELHGPTLARLFAEHEPVRRRKAP